MGFNKLLIRPLRAQELDREVSILGRTQFQVSNKASETSPNPDRDSSDEGCLHLPQPHCQEMEDKKRERERESSIMPFINVKNFFST